jgi:hypothetical protein
MLNSSRLLTHTIVLLCSLAAANLVSADPSGRVAHVTDTQGSISYSPAGESEWVDVVWNRPLIQGDRLWSAQDSQAEFQVGSSAVRLGPGTSVEILDLNNNIAQLRLDQGSVNVRIRRLYKGQTLEVDTPMLAFSINRSGRYRIDVDPYDGQTTISVWKGAGTAYGEGANFRVKAGEAVAFYDIYLRDYEIYGLADEDDFDRYAVARDQRWEQSVSLQYVDDDLVGYAALDTYGSWGLSASYGNVWYPTSVSVGWAPYRDGHWIWQEPWGWTWVDNAPWGFAPSHYGRWVYVGYRWAWVPGPRRVRPIYAPALVAFVGGSGWNVPVSIGGGAQPIGWFPIGPREVYVPSYPVSRDYFNQVNVNNTVVNNTTITNVYNNYSSGTINVNQVNYANRNVQSAVTVVPSNVFVNAQPVAPAVLRVDRKKLAAGETMRIAPIAPSERSVIGAGKAAKVRPAKEVYDRPVVVHNAPPPAEQPFAKREKQLQKNPGQPVSTSPPDTAQAKDSKPARNVLVVSDQQAAVDARTAAMGRQSKSGKTEQLDRSARAQKKRSKSAQGVAPQGAQQQQQADAVKQAAQQQQQQADADQQAAQQQQQANADKQAAQQKQRQADSDKQAAKQQQRQADQRAAQQMQLKADGDKQAAMQQQQADAEKQAAQQKQRQADSDKQAAKQQQQQADADQQAAQQQVDTDKQAAQQKQRQADSDKQAAKQQQRQIDADQRAAQQQQQQIDTDQRAAQQQQQQADADQRAAQQQQRQADIDSQAAHQQQQTNNEIQPAQPPQGQQQRRGKLNNGGQRQQATTPQSPEPTVQDNGKQQKSKNRTQADCERAAVEQNQDPSECQNHQ